MKLSSAIPFTLAATSLLFSASAGAVAIGKYTLHSHPDGNQNPPPYGLRLDGLLTGNSNEEYTFDFDHPSSNMTLVWDGSKIVIDGQAFGGEDEGNSYKAGTTAVWDIHFEYTVGVSQPGGEGGLNDVKVNADNANFGTVNSVLGSFELEDEAGSGLSFQLGDENGGGHRGYNGISGWGWLNHGPDCISSDCSHIYASDWLFTAKPVPVPAAIWLFGSGLIGLIGVSRRKSAA